MLYKNRSTSKTLEIIDTEIRLEAIVRESLALVVLDCRVENERTNWRQGATGYTVIDGFGACAHRGEGADVEGEYFMMTWWSRYIGH